MKSYYKNYNYLKMMKDFLLTQKSIRQERNFNQVSFVSEDNCNKVFVKKGFKSLFDIDIVCKNISVIKLRKTLLTRKRGRVIYRYGSKSRVKGSKKWIISLSEESLQKMRSWFQDNGDFEALKKEVM